MSPAGRFLCPPLFGYGLSLDTGRAGISQGTASAEKAGERWQSGGITLPGTGTAGAVPEIQKVYGKFGRAVRKFPVEFTEEMCAARPAAERNGIFREWNPGFSQQPFLGSGEYCGLLNTYSDHRAMEENARAGLMEGSSSAIMRFGGRLELRDTMDLYLARKP